VNCVSVSLLYYQVYVNVYCVRTCVQVTQAIQFLHDLGSVQHFQNEFLKSRVVINPQWIVDAMSCIVSVQNTPIVVSVRC